MKKTLMMLLFLVAAIWANAQRGYGGHHHYPQHYGAGYYAPPPIAYSPIRFNCNSYNRRPFINVVIAPRPRVIVAQESQLQVVREWVEPHWEEASNGRVWVEGHYVQREVY